jgi:hypothetical protein
MNLKVGDHVKAYSYIHGKSEGIVHHISRQSNYCRQMAVVLIKECDDELLIGTTWVYALHNITKIYNNEQERLNYKYGYKKG